MSNPKISILVPIYKAAGFIERCADSLFNQTFQDIEFVFVNDCTPDNSIEKLNSIINQYPHKKDRIKLIHHKTNRGSGASRKSAIKASTGQYISFVDADDYIEPDMIEILYNKAIEENADIVVSDFFTEFTDKSIYCVDAIDEKSQNNFSLIIKQEQTYPCLWNKLIKRELLLRPDCQIPEGLNYAEDLHLMTRLYYFAQKISKINQGLYHYVRYNSNAFTKSKSRMHFENMILFWNLFDTFLKQHNEYEKYSSATELPKLQTKIQLMIDTNSYTLRKEFSNIFTLQEMRHISELRKGERLMLFFIQKKMFWQAQVFHYLLVAKNNIKKSVFKSKNFQFI